MAEGGGPTSGAVKGQAVVDATTLKEFKEREVRHIGERFLEPPTPQAAAIHARETTTPGLALVLYTDAVTKEQANQFYSTVCDTARDIDQHRRKWEKLIPDAPVTTKERAIELLKQLGERKASEAAFFYFGHGAGSGGSLACAIDSEHPQRLESYLFLYEIGETVLQENPNLEKFYVFLGCCFACGGDMTFLAFNFQRKMKFPGTRDLFLVRVVGSSSDENILVEDEVICFSSYKVEPDFVLWSFLKENHRQDLWDKSKAYINVTDELPEDKKFEALLENEGLENSSQM